MIEELLERFAATPSVKTAALRAARRVDALPQNDTNRRVRAAVLSAFEAEALTETDLWGTMGYGYDDAARAHYESLLARVLNAETVLARLSLVSGTHAIVTAISACVRTGERLVVATGRPYDTLRNALVEAPHSLVRGGIQYAEVPLGDDGKPQIDALVEHCAEGCAAVFVQRSRGYAPRPSLSAATCGEVAAAVKTVAPDVPVLVDNCYGELVEEHEPTAHGCDVLIGSLIKNLGGGLAPGGAYIAGRRQFVERIAAYHYAPGIGSAIGPTFGFGRAFVQGLFQAPLVIGESLAGLDFAAALFAELGYPVDPLPGAVRRDVVQAIRLGDPGRLMAFARGMQRAMPVNARFVPEPGPVPGYPEAVIMSTGAFVPGSTIDLSCDAPLRAPYDVYVQGGMMREHVVLGALRAAEGLWDAGIL
ncbi:MAG: methionine gamma-lyase family protein [Candidatus Eremiobacteraeota bacterium]|nr:methionine gamma-lyase family protein [Candidatus Eremiobacteraeota bacterium]